MKPSWRCRTTQAHFSGVMRRLLRAILLVMSLNLGGRVCLGDSKAFESLKNIQIANASDPLLDEGHMEFHVEDGILRQKVLTQIEGTVTWQGESRLWVYRLSEPSGRVLMSDWSWSAPLSEASTQYRLETKNHLYSYDSHKNMLAIYRKKVNDRFSTTHLLDVLPKHHWYRCYPPHHTSGEGRPWAEMIGPSPTWASKGQVYEISREGDLITQVRRDPDGGVQRMTFSMAYGGRPTEFRYERAGERRIVRQGTYTWSKHSDGLYTLKHYRLTSDDSQAPEKGTYIYWADFKNIRLGPNTAGKPLRFETLVSLLPPDTIVQDHERNRAYPLNKGYSGVSQTQFESLSSELRSRGFLKEKR
jgi:hypothetical protein